jgi:uncharacterized integral membrane protein
MPLRSILILLVLGVIALFATLNWGAFTAPTSLRLGFKTFEAPLGLIMLGVTVLLVFLFLVFVAYLQTSVLIEGRRHTRELQAQRELADQSEASRYSQLRQFFEAELQRLSDEGQQRQAEVLGNLEQLDRDLRITIEQSGNMLAAYIGELDDRLQRQLGGTDQSKPD